eukprot:TRINITY_DN1260_c3_g2_i1.p1 TRINITY_DN1260_c3_g2~~TRINITY_DN1260_c3_g2_i1.p1  ORF type:complete len:223 (+),score=21.32 TRINITY_DN1260_c3_g2_i1:131-799(+)
MTDQIPDESLFFLSQYTQNPNLDFLRERVLEVWEESKSRFHVYKCIERLRFLTPRIDNHHFYQTLTKDIHDGKEIKVLDVGCAFGQDTRKLIVDGLAHSNIYSIDIVSSYWELGRKLFMDPESFSSNFMIGNVADPSFNSNQQLTEKFDYIYAGAVLHVLSKEDVEVFLQNIFILLKKGGFFFGHSVGSVEPRLWIQVPNNPNKLRFLHSSASLKELFEKVG